jgi:AraC family transcriptional activator FtrA
MSWASQRLAEPVTVPRLAERAAMSERTLLRQFRKQVGMAPKKWLLQERVRRAQRLLERSDLPLERISASCGFSSAETFRATFRRIALVAPSAYRRAFRGA